MRTHRTVQATNRVSMEELLGKRDLREGIARAEPTQKRRRTHFARTVNQQGPEFKVYCPYRKCDLKVTPTLRQKNICDDHIALHGYGVK